MRVDVVVPDDYIGNVIGDLNSRRGQIQNQETRNGSVQVTAFVPLSEMFGYSNDLRSKTQGPRPVCNAAEPLHRGSEVHFRGYHEQAQAERLIPTANCTLSAFFCETT